MDPSASSRLKLLALWFGSFKSHLSKMPTGVQSTGTLDAGWGRRRREELGWHLWCSSYSFPGLSVLQQNHSKMCRVFKWTPVHLLTWWYVSWPLAILLLLVLSDMILGKSHLDEKTKQAFSSNAILPLLLLQMSWVCVWQYVCAHTVCSKNTWEEWRLVLAYSAKRSFRNVWICFYLTQPQPSALLIFHCWKQPHQRKKKR